MREAVQQWVESLPIPEPLAVVLLAALPITELRLAIPFARGVLEWSVVPAFFWSVLGNLLPVPFILWLLGPVTAWAEKHWSWLHRFLEKLFAHTRRRHTTRFDRLRDLALIAFVAIPLPITGAWSGSLAAFVFGVQRRKALALIALGVMIAGVVVSILYEAGVFLAES
ncbi:MAG: small multi-drug export protein [Acidimicrobiia bacterium]|nr:small multi-drug export protein [Acidimicrobiia bacterium]